MPSIVTITFNPAIDKSTSVTAMVSEKKLTCTPPLFEPGGGGINVARAIKKLGGEATALYLAGGYTGKFFTQLLDKENITSEVTEISAHTRENLIVLDSTANQQYRFGMPGPAVEPDEWKKLLTTLEQMNEVQYIVASGSLPQGVPIDVFAQIAVIAKQKKAHYIVDTNGEALKLAVAKGVYLIKPNLGELSALVGEDELQPDMIAVAARKVIAKGQCKYVMVSMGAAGAMLVTNDMATTISTPPVKRRSTVGAGDSMVAGIVFSLSKGNEITAAAHYGVACGTAATMNPGTELCKAADADRLYKLIYTG
ncbi:1-phosphofructokinase family hexose kinase [Ferruginibacter lapsinanis]|uniref:1-phosphofructokinase family hexose kinase n=1 Tax=Ferruginibacter lapsinanis TaxID=563172 RepID=UPI001E47FD2B|nr:1-phosphofructokinase family hexose kinase [Ferruginibacter lapsinanis]UEG50790.1 1-phosphofructokinase family hexose kinase [Ferruginibacter lapsinanis]